MIKFFIAGPMRGVPRFNFPLFFTVEEVLSLYYPPGTPIFNPARVDVDTWGWHPFHSNVTGDVEALEIDFKAREVMARNLAWLCAEATCIWMLPYWQQSWGAKAEFAVAQALGIEVRLAYGEKWLEVVKEVEEDD